MTARAGRNVAALVAALALTGCATAPPGSAPHDRDPYQSANRALFSFNEGVDRWVLEPVSRGWTFVTPKEVRLCVDRFMRNLGFPARFLSSLGQAEVARAGSELGRFFVNTTVGVAGLFDPATRLGLAQHDEDFGQMFGRWGLPSGPYWMLPLLGPSGPRDALGLVFDTALDVAIVVPGLGVLRAVNTRALAADDIALARTASLDYYVLVRDAYLQRRRAQIADSELKPPVAAPGDDLYEDGLYELEGEVDEALSPTGP